MAQLTPYWFKTNDATAYDPAPDLAPTMVNTGNILVLNADYVGTDAAVITNNKNYVQFNNQIASFSGGTAAFRVTPIPVVLDNNVVTFNGEKVGNYNRLHWTIDNEEEVAEYRLIRSEDGIQSEELATQNPLGQTAYSLTDTEPYARTYYRLKIIKADATFEYTNWVLLERQPINDNTVKIYPNPTEGALVIDFWSEQKSTLNLRIIDVLGRELIKQTINTKIGQNHYNLNINDLPTAVYVLTMGDGTQRVVRKITKR